MSAKKPSAGHAEARKLATELQDKPPLDNLIARTISYLIEHPAHYPPPLPDPVRSILQEDPKVKRSTQEKHIARWAAVCAELDQHGWDGHQFENASKKLTGQPAYASAAAMKSSYDYVQQHARPGMKRPDARLRRTLGKKSLT